MRVLICGGRNYRDYDEADILVREALATIPLIAPEKHEVVFITGCATGADEIPIRMYEGEEDEWGGLLKFPADWDRYGKKAGILRNQQMIDEGKPDLVIAFPGGKGTADMIKRAYRHGIEVWRLGE